MFSFHRTCDTVWKYCAQETLIDRFWEIVQSMKCLFLWWYAIIIPMLGSQPWWAQGHWEIFQTTRRMNNIQVCSLRSTCINTYKHRERGKRRGGEGKGGVGRRGEERRGREVEINRKPFVFLSFDSNYNIKLFPHIGWFIEVDIS